MTSRKVLILGIVAILAVGGGLLLAGRETSSPGAESAALYPDLKKELDAVTAIRLVKAGGQPALELKRGDSGWTIAERANYPADDAKLRKLITSLSEAKLVEEKTSNAESYKTLGVEDISDAAASGVQIEIDGPKQPVKLIVGKQASGGQSHYVRRAGEPQSWLVNKSIDTSSSADQWLKKQIIDVSADRVQSAQVAVAGAKPYTASKKSRADADFAVEGLPKGKELSSPTAADSFATALAGLTLTDVQSASAVSGEPSARATIKTFDGLVTEASGWKKDDKHFISLKTSHDPALADRFKAAAAEPAKPDAAPATGEGTPPSAAETKPAAEPAKPTTVNVAEESTKTNAQVDGWVYEIPAYKYDAIFKPVDELVKK